MHNLSFKNNVYKMLVLFLFITVLPISAEEGPIFYRENSIVNTDATANEKDYFSTFFQTRVITNVSKPSILFYPADPNIATGTSVIVVPGGGFRALSINSEGIDVAKWLNKKGISVFVLKYRLVPTGDVSEQELLASMKKQNISQNNKAIPLAIDDGKAAVEYIRKNAEKFGISPNKIGMIGFSAGGTVASYVALDSIPTQALNFVALLYASNHFLKQAEYSEKLPPLFAAVATNDQLKRAVDSIDIYQYWLKNQHSAELHIYAKGGHGFGMRKQSLPSDDWINQFYHWLGLNGF